MKTKRLFLVCAALGILAFQSCDKDSTVLPAPTPVPASKTLLMGNWLLTSNGLDTSRDGILQPSESIPLQPGTYGALTITNTDIIDSMSYASGDGYNQTYPYTLNGDSLTYTTPNATLTFIVHRVTPTNLELYGRSVTYPDVWFFYTRM